MDPIPEQQLDNSPALDNNIKGHCNPDIAKVLLIMLDNPKIK